MVLTVEAVTQKKKSNLSEEKNVEKLLWFMKLHFYWQIFWKILQLAVSSEQSPFFACLVDFLRLN